MVEDGVMIALAAVRLAAKNRIILSAVRDRLDFDESGLTRFVRTVLDSLYARHITLAKASGYLDNLKIKDLHQLERYYEGV